jgi:muramoyltetrapeptide carboxypeptidase
MPEQMMHTAESLPNPFPEHIRTVGVAAPCGIPDPERLARGKRRLETWGLEVVDRTQGLTPDRFLAATDNHRQKTLRELLSNRHVHAIVAARGGYGAARLLPLLDWERIRQRNLPIVGYSDCTALHMAALANGCTNHIFGPMVTGDFARIPDNEDETAQLAAVFASLRTAFAPPPNTPVCGTPLHALRRGTATGPVTPANLAVLTSLLGTPFFPDLSDCILVLEDVNEAAYRVDRCLNQLDQAGVLGKLGGLVFGQFTDCEDGQWIPEVMKCFATRINGPVARGLPFGHAFPSIALPVGIPATLTANPPEVRFAWAHHP